MDTYPWPHPLNVAIVQGLPTEVDGGDVRWKSTVLVQDALSHEVVTQLIKTRRCCSTSPPVPFLPIPQPLSAVKSWSIHSRVMVRRAILSSHAGVGRVTELESPLTAVDRNETTCFVSQTVVAAPACRYVGVVVVAVIALVLVRRSRHHSSKLC